MNRGAAITAGVLAAALAAGTGYWAGSRRADAEGAAATAADGARPARKLLYYRNPMGLPDTSPVPKKDPMGMDYLPVYEGEDREAGAANPNQLRIGPDKVQKLGVRTEPATLRTLDRVVRAAGRIEPDEARTFAVTPKFEGFVERLHVNVTGQPVARGQALFEVYSPELVSAQREYQIAVQGVEALEGADGDARRSMRQLADASLARLRNWDVPEEQVRALARSGGARRVWSK